MADPSLQLWHSSRSRGYKNMNEALEGDDTLPVVAHESWDSLRKRLLLLDDNESLMTELRRAVHFASMSEALQFFQNKVDITSRNQDPRSSEWLRLLLRCVRSAQDLPQDCYDDDVLAKSFRPEAGGGFGDVYKGSLRGEIVALKVPEVEQTAALRREVLLWRQLSHPNIQQFRGVCRNLFAPRLGIISDWAQHGTLIDAAVTMPIAFLNEYRPRWVNDIVAGLQYLHDRGIVHGDLSAENVLIDEGHTYSARLSDFGLSRLASSHTRTHGIFGGKTSVYYTSPELLKRLGRSPDFACDVYSFACTCIALYSGKRPFHGIVTQIDSVILQGLRPAMPVDSATDNGRQMPHWLSALVENCLRQAPDERPTCQTIIRVVRSHI
ncbi:hypothetical protein EIP91_005012 [Steccherinum ochraceum]|uniref:Protein kinase domain-containing protein n=1 Tax=Steccherinum ochraceum TaxID=92696 RepID=A0A4V2MVS6_9APHY|nr:hypothetical protein EIP91_005012 [Steccherinum ochraceum]